KVFGPFLIAAPLSTTSNWVEEFRKWTPSIPVILYHGTKSEREEIRRERLRSPGAPDFPVVVTSYEICMNDRRFLAGFGWKFIIIVSLHCQAIKARGSALNLLLIRTKVTASRISIAASFANFNHTSLLTVC